ncbi:hypothetical protein C9994_01350 [Marivirga lumbricoides]|uniref:Uncharacterized protein n=1 Tax=Marivirga lumbricoides TaxID=1046115 RepID=A0A2T4DVA6_9BACT|nr:hypothetical protein C9994_01350 [Marivirga lumbricoides]
MTSLLLFCILFILCWPLAILLLVLYPFIWLLSIPFRLLGIAVNFSFSLIESILLFPFRLIRR